MSNLMEEVSKKLVEDYINQTDWRVNENANMAYSLQGLNNYIKEEVSKYYWMNYIYPKDVKQAHVDGRFHLHDSGSLSGYCMGLDLEDLLEVGFYGGPGKIRSGAPKHLGSALGTVVNLMYAATNDIAGAVAVSNLDTLMAPFIAYDNLNKEQVKQAVQEFIFNMNVPTRTGAQTPFSNVTLDFVVPKHMADKPVLIGGKRMDRTYKEFQKEMDIFNECFFEVMNEGDSDGRIFSFPIPTVNITKDFDWDNPRYAAMWKNTAKYGQPYFCNYVSSDMSPEDAMSMCPLSANTIIPTTKGAKALIDIRLGDFVYDLHGKPTKVCAITLHPSMPGIKVGLENGVCVEFGAEHLQPLYRNGVYYVKPAKDIRLGDKIPCFEVDETEDPCVKWTKQKYKFISVVSLQACPATDYYCITVDNDAHLFRLANGVITHNCRLRIDLSELKRKGGLFGANPLTGSVSVCTINFPRLGYLHKNDEKGFFAELDEVLDLAKKALEIRREQVEKWTEQGLFPIMKFYLRKTKARFNKYWTNHFSTIATLGMNECCLNMFGYGIGDARGREFALKVMNYLRSKAVEFQKQTGHQYNIEQSPAESCFLDETEVQTMTGSMKIKDLVGKENVYVYSWDEEASKVVLRKMVACQKTSDSAEVVRVRFTNGQELICTPNHPFGVRVFNTASGKKVEEIMWVPAGLLKPGNRIKSDYITTRAVSDYYVHNSHQWQHHIVSEYFNGELPEGYVVHHKDLNKHNNVPENLQVMSEAEHKALHIRLKHEQEPEKYIPQSGSKNPFYGHHHKEETKELFRKNGKRKEHVEKLVAMVRSPEMRKRYSEIAKAKRPEQCSNYNHAIDTNEIVRLYEQGLKLSDIAKRIGNGCTYSIVKGRLTKLGILQPNHVVESVEVLPYKVPVYNLEVEGTHNYFVGGDQGVLVHNCSYRLAKVDKKKYPDIIVADNDMVVKDGAAPFYTNSTQLPVNFTNDVFELLDNQAEINALYTGGSVQHLYLGERVKDIEAMKQLIKTTFENYTIPYISITPTFSVCPVHGYLSGEHLYCPQCRQEEIHKIDLEEERIKALLSSDEQASKGEVL